MKKLNKLVVAFGAAILFGIFSINADKVQASYSIDYTFAFNADQGSSQLATHSYIIMHETATEASGRNVAANMKNNYTPYTAYSTFVVGDGGKVYQVGQPGYVAYAAGNANGYSPVQIELQHTYDKAEFAKNYATYIELARDYAKKYGIPTTLDAGGAGTPGIKSHLWITQNIWGDHVDPYGYLASMGVSKAKLANDLAKGTTNVGGGNTTPTNPTKPTTPSNSNVPAGFTPENGTFVNGDTEIMNRVGAASFNAAQGGYLPAYGTWKYDSWKRVGNYVMIHHVYNGVHVFLPVRYNSAAWGTFK
ncbi:peptidoglycan recognition protein family protein [Latilactobacillus sakei]|uniref:peptidoglycan recognition protein family protein n=1 Tax=Latilactobacillus sakei TaxID=1599 RepID=UPI000C133870|nr:putative N-acetylmuramoyl-L-alanine amidase [Latilactobacillus sakei]